MNQPHNALEIVQPASVVVDATEVLRVGIAQNVMRTFQVSIAATYSIIVVWGLGYLPHLPVSFAHWLGGATVGQTAGLLAMIVRSLFPQVPGNKSKK